MSFIYHPSKIVYPKIPSLSPDDLWFGSGADAGLIAFATGTSTIGRRVITAGDICYRFSVSGWNDFAPVYGSCNDYIFWYSSSGYWLYYIAENPGRWIIHNKFPGYIPVATVDGWYEAQTLPFGDGATTAFAVKGKQIGEGKTVQFSFPRWFRATPFGRYGAAGGKSGEKALGLPRWQDGDGTYYVRSFSKSAGRFSYEAIRYDVAAAAWVIGTPGSADGWFVGSEPVVSGSVVFYFMLPEGSEAERKADLTISFVDYIAGNQVTTVWMGESAIWRA